MNSIISLRVNDEEKEILSKASAVYGCGLSSMIKTLVFEKLEEEYSLKVISEYEKQKAKGSVKTYSHDEVWNELDV